MSQPLPATLELITEMIGEDAAMALAAAKGGQRIYLPAHIKSGHWLVELIGLEAATLLCEHWTGEALVVPMGPVGTLAQVQRLMRRRRAEALARGLSANQVAAASGYSIRQVYRTRATQRCVRARGQKDLFNFDDNDTF